MSRVNLSDANFSFLSGFHFRFTINGKELIYLVSAWTGKEFILYDGEKISDLRTYKKNSSHSFLIDGVGYRVTLTMNSLLKLDWHCCLYREDNIVKCFNIYYKTLGFPIKVLCAMASGVLLSLTPKYLWFICIPIICAVGFKLIMGKLVCKVHFGDRNSEMD